MSWPSRRVTSLAVIGEGIRRFPDPGPPGGPLSNQELIVLSAEGPWTQLAKGLSNSLVAIFWSLS